MRLEVLEHGHRPLQKLQLAMIRLLTGDVPGPILLMSYRRKLFGQLFAACCQEAMRRGSAWTDAEREIFAAFVSRQNRCSY